MKLPDIRVTASLGIVIIVAAYCSFLYFSWESYKDERDIRMSALDEILDRIPTKGQSDEPASADVSDE